MHARTANVKDMEEGETDRWERQKVARGGWQKSHTHTITYIRLYFLSRTHTRTPTNTRVSAYCITII